MSLSSPGGRRRLAVLLALLPGLAVALTGCEQGLRPPENVQIYVSTGSGHNVVGQVSMQRLAGQIAQEFMQLNPGVNLHLRVVPQGELLRSVQQRATLGASPDLMISRVSVAYALRQQGLSQPTGLTPAQLAPLRVRYLQQFTNNGQVLILPLLVQPAVACYDRDRMPKPPRTLQQLLELADSGDRIGLSLQIDELLWTAAGFGAQDVLLRLLDSEAHGRTPRPLRPLEYRQLVQWLSWLQTNNAAQPNLQFFETEEALVTAMLHGKLDWISCQGPSLRRLEQAMGRRLGVVALPQGPDGQPPHALARIMAFSFGRDSTPSQRRVAQNFALFALNSYVQNNMVMAALGNMPANQHVLVPKKQSGAMAALEQSLRTSLVPDFSHRVWIGNLVPVITQLVKLAIYGEATPEQTVQRLQKALAQASAGMPEPGPSSAPILSQER